MMMSGIGFGRVWVLLEGWWLVGNGRAADDNPCLLTSLILFSKCILLVFYIQMRGQECCMENTVMVVKGVST